MVYVSYSQQDRDVVEWICRALRVRGVQLFVDHGQLTSGDYAQGLAKQIESAKAILLIYSDNTENSAWVKHAIEFSLSKNKIIIPVILTEPGVDSWFRRCFGNLDSVHSRGIGDHYIADKIITVLARRNVYISSETFKSINDGCTKTYSAQQERHLTSAVPPSAVPHSKRLIIILAAIVLLSVFPLYIVRRDNVAQKDIICYVEERQADSLGLLIKSTVLKCKVDELLSRLHEEIENPVMAGSDDYAKSIIHEIESILGVGPIPFPADSFNTQEERIKAYCLYRETVYSVLERRIAEMELELEIGNKTDTVQFAGGPNDSEEDDTIDDEAFSHIGLLMLISFLVGGGLMALMFKVKRYKKNNVKLSSDIAAKITIDGDLHKEIESREVYSTHLDKGEYLIDFEDKNDENRHKTFNYEVVTKDCKLVFANFLEEEPLSTGKTIKCFIAGSKTLQRERDALRAVTCVMYNKWDSKNFRILSYTFEDFEKQHTIVPPQELYNKFIEKEADWALFVVDGKIGGITVDEYRVAMDSFKKNGRPKILALAKIGAENNDNDGINEIREEINKEHQYWTDYTDIVSLKYIFESTLTWDLIKMFQDN